MPSLRPPSQPDDQAPGWLRSGLGQQMVGELSRAAVPELTRVFGQHGLYLRPSAAIPAELSGNMLAHVVALEGWNGRFGGQLRCRDDELPVANASLSLVYALFTLEGSPDPAALMAEIARLLKPEGIALVVGLNGWAMARLHPTLAGAFSVGGTSLERLADDAGLEQVRQQYIGPLWPRASRARLAGGGNRWFDGFRVATLTVLRRREAGLTPLRKLAPAVSLRPGMSVG